MCLMSTNKSMESLLYIIHRQTAMTSYFGGGHATETLHKLQRFARLLHKKCRHKLSRLKRSLIYYTPDPVIQRNES